MVYGGTVDAPGLGIRCETRESYRSFLGSPVAPLAVGEHYRGVLFTDRHTTLPAGVGGRGGPPRGTKGDLRGRSVALG